jgi:hypothetical protein
MLAANNSYITRAIILDDIRLSISNEVEGLRNFYLKLGNVLEDKQTVKEIYDAYRVDMDDTELVLTKARNFSMLDPGMPASLMDKLNDPDDTE